MDGEEEAEISEGFYMKGWRWKLKIFRAFLLIIILFLISFILKSFGMELNFWEFALELSLNMNKYSNLALSILTFWDQFLLGHSIHYQMIRNKS
jgi:hypothetical protein